MSIEDPEFLTDNLELQELVWDDPLEALSAIERIRGTGEQSSPPMLADLEVRARLRCRENLPRAESVAKQIVAHRGDASAYELLAEVIEAIGGRAAEAIQCRKRAAELPNKMVTPDVERYLEEAGFKKLKK